MPDELDRFKPTLAQFAGENGMTVKYPSPENREEWERADYQCQLSFVNSHGQLCFLYVDRYQPVGFQVRLQRWGLHGLIANKHWELAYSADPTDLRAVLVEARECADAPVKG